MDLKILSSVEILWLQACFQSYKGVVIKCHQGVAEKVRWKPGGNIDL